MTTGTLLDRAFRLYTGNFSLMLGITAAAYVPFYLIMLAIQSGLGINPQSQSGGLMMIFFQVVFLILWASTAFPIASGAATYAISERYLGRDVAIGDALKQGLSRFWTLSVAQIIVSIRVMIGFILLIVPGILWMLSYSLVIPAISVEGQKSGASVRRSRDLVHGHRGKVFCVLFVINVLQALFALGVNTIVEFLVSVDSGGGEIMYSALNHLLSIFLTPLGIITTILLYYDLRIRKEGFDLEMLSEGIAARPHSVAATPSLSG